MNSGRVLTLIGLAALLVIAVFGTIATQDKPYGMNHWFYWYSVTRHERNVEIEVKTRGWRGCPDPQFPISVSVNNNSGRTVESVSFFFEARLPGRSTDLIAYTTINKNRSDYILPPGKSVGFCYGVPSLQQKVDNPLTELEWSTALKSVTFRD